MMPQSNEIMPDQDHNIFEMLKSIAEDIKYLKDAEEQSKQRDAALLKKLEGVEQKLEAMRRDQLDAILTQMERFAKELETSNNHTEMMINAQALVDTVQFEKKDLEALLKEAFPKNEDTARVVEAKLETIKNNMQGMYDDIMDNVNGLAKLDYNYAKGILDEIRETKRLVGETDRNISKVDQAVRSMPGRSLY